MVFVLTAPSVFNNSITFVRLRQSGVITVMFFFVEAKAKPSRTAESQANTLTRASGVFSKGDLKSQRVDSRSNLISLSLQFLIR